MRIPTVAVTVGLLLSACAHAKCPLIYLRLEGRIVDGLAQGELLAVRAEPDGNAAAVQLEVEAEVFRAELPFDSTRSGGMFWHDCSRRPRKVTVVLSNEDKEEARVVLDFKRDFERTPSGDYKSRGAILLKRRR